MSTSERRKCTRFPVRAEIEYQELVSASAELLVTASRNISAGGVCVVTFREFSVGTELGLRLKLPDAKKAVTVRGRVAWSKELGIGDKKLGGVYEAGIEFIQINEEDKKRIDEYVVEHGHSAHSAE